MNKNDLVNQVSDNTGLSKSDSAKAVDSVLDTITDTLKSGGDVRLVGFGTFLVSKRKATTGRNPQTGAAINIPAANVPKFRPGKALKESLN
ncbi:MAG: DNA-binding protein HU [Alphaproteobacteria bacterium]|nr:DNA-binding protein HU [Alphaproteobacteria bacterium]